MQAPMRRLASRCLMALAAAGCGSDAPEIHPRDQTVKPPAFDRAPSFSIDDSAPRDSMVTGPTADPPEPEPAPSTDVGQCDPNYAPCVPIDSDVDCEGGRGDGPSYVSGPVRVIGRDVYRLDEDGDGIGCERGRGRP